MAQFLREFVKRGDVIFSNAVFILSKKSWIFKNRGLVKKGEIMKKEFLIPLALIVLFANNAEFNPDAAENGVYRTYLVNRSRHFVEYTIESMDYGIISHAGVLPPEKDCESQVNASLKEGATESAGLPGVLKLDLPLGEYKICLTLPQEDEKCYTKILRKSDYNNSLIPYWEIEDEQTEHRWDEIKVESYIGDMKRN